MGKILSINLTAPYILAKRVFSILKESKGQIINISSTRALMSEREQRHIVPQKVELAL